MIDDAPIAALIASNVHISYRTYLDAPQPLRARLTRTAEPRRHRDVHAVRGVDLTLHEGESLGLIGNNGSGKSSLLVGLAGLMDLEDGEVLATSRPALLGVGAALNRRLSGRRNIEMGCLALGLSRDEVAERMPAIIEFSGLQESIDLPMKTYSSGMRARLAFSIATELTPEILLIDEALAVGDRAFRSRAADRLEDIRAGAGAIIVVSHNLNEISQMCSRVAWMHKGQIREIGDPDEVLAAYSEANPSERKAAKVLSRKAERRARAATDPPEATDGPGAPATQPATTRESGLP